MRKIVINCYKFHGREDLLPAFSEEDEKANQLATLNSSVASSHVSPVRLLLRLSEKPRLELVIPPIKLFSKFIKYQNIFHKNSFNELFCTGILGWRFEGAQFRCYNNIFESR